MRKYFGTDGIRRIANTELSPSLVFRVAKSRSISIIRIYRKSTYNFYRKRYTYIRNINRERYVSRFLSYGANVKTLGVIPTPAVAYLTKNTTQMQVS